MANPLEPEVDITPTMSSSSGTHLYVWVDDRREVVRTKGPPCTLPLAHITSNRLDLPRIRSLAKEVDAWSDGDEQLFSWITTSALADAMTPFLPARSQLVSRRFSREDLTALSAAGIWSEGPSSLVATAFKVPKSDGCSSRLVWDGSAFNDTFVAAGLKLPTMELPDLHDVIEASLRFPFGAMQDATSYFYQFRVSQQLSKLFGVRWAEKRGHFVAGCLAVLAMGVCFAPAAAQRTSNATLAILRDRMRRAGWSAEDFAVFCWMDNFLFFARTAVALKCLLSEFERLAKEVSLEVKPPVMPNDGILQMLGLEVHLGQSVRLPAPTREALMRATGPEFSGSSIRQAMSLIGVAMWANYAIARRPLCLAPAFMTTVRQLCRRGFSAGWDVTHDLGPEELQHIDEFCRLLAQAERLPEPTPTISDEVIWTDASMTKVAGVRQKGLTDVDVFAVPHGLATINAAEMLAVGHATMTWRLERGTTIAIDNTGVVAALRKGHSRSAVLDAMLAVMLPRLPPEAHVTWVPTNAKRADGPSRGGPVTLAPVRVAPSARCRMKWRLDAG
jgi:hypothetical protein